MNSPDNSQDLFLFHEYCIALDSMVGAIGRYLRIGTNLEPPCWIVAYNDVPATGSTTAFTFGISSVSNAAWQLGVPELVISINSTDEDWLLSLGALSCSMRGKCPFSLGNILRFGLPLCKESAMSAYFLFWPTILQEDQLQLRLPGRTVNFVQAYPIFESETKLITKRGAEEFFMADGLDFADVKRNEAV